MQLSDFELFNDCEGVVDKNELIAENCDKIIQLLSQWAESKILTLDMYKKFVYYGYKHLCKLCMLYLEINTVDEFDEYCSLYRNGICYGYNKLNVEFSELNLDFIKKNCDVLRYIYPNNDIVINAREILQEYCKLLDAIDDEHRYEIYVTGSVTIPVMQKYLGIPVTTEPNDIDVFIKWMNEEFVDPVKLGECLENLMNTSKITEFYRKGSVIYAELDGIKYNFIIVDYKPTEVFDFHCVRSFYKNKQFITTVPVIYSILHKTLTISEGNAKHSRIEKYKTRFSNIESPLYVNYGDVTAYLTGDPFPVIPTLDNILPMSYDPYLEKHCYSCINENKECKYTIIAKNYMTKLEYMYVYNENKIGFPDNDVLSIKCREITTGKIRHFSFVYNLDRTLFLKFLRKNKYFNACILQKCGIRLIELYEFPNMNMCMNDIFTNEPSEHIFLCGRCSKINEINPECWAPRSHEIRKELVHLYYKDIWENVKPDLSVLYVDKRLRNSEEILADLNKESDEESDEESDYQPTPKRKVRKLIRRNN